VRLEGMCTVHFTNKHLLYICHWSGLSVHYVIGQVCQFIMSLVRSVSSLCQKPVLSHCRYKYFEMTNNIVSIRISHISSLEGVQHITVLQPVEQHPATSDHNINVAYSDLVIQKLHTMIYSFKFHVYT
jgi:cytochrome oxidase assembly protein ShyY1